ncbi:efflux transporter outer membrane subunit [soil metagenome]
MKSLFALTTMTAALVLAGCSTIPDVAAPRMDVPGQFKAAAVADSQWKPATPQDTQLRGDWWRQFGDESLNQLVERALGSTEAGGAAGSPSLAVLAARVSQARAVARLADAARAPQVSLQTDVNRTGGNARTPGYPDTLYRAQGIFNYELDLFGRLSDEAQAARLDAQGQAMSYESARTALAADIAQNWFQLKGLDEDQKLLAATVALREDDVRLTDRRVSFGDATERDSARAQTELATTRAELYATQRSRALVESSLAVLIGQPASSFSVAASDLPSALPTVPVGLPSTLLERRPDIAAAQRRLLAANARIGAANAAFFPSVSLTAGAGFASGQLSDLFNWGSRAWLLGPLAALPIFDGGARRANLANAQAGYEASVGEYRQQVLVAFKDVEDSLTTLSTLSQQGDVTEQAVRASTRATDLSRTQYREGFVSYYEVIDAQRTTLALQRSAVSIRTQRAAALVALMRALGGGWEQSAS